MDNGMNPTFLPKYQTTIQGRRSIKLSRHRIANVVKVPNCKACQGTKSHHVWRHQSPCVRASNCTYCQGAESHFLWGRRVVLTVGALNSTPFEGGKSHHVHRCQIALLVRASNRAHYQGAESRSTPCKGAKYVPYEENNLLRGATLAKPLLRHLA